MSKQIESQNKETISYRELIRKEYTKCMESPEYFMRFYVKIKHPIRGTIPFELYEFQKKTIDDLLNFKFNVILKSRQMGISTLVACYSLWLMTFNNDKNILLISLKQDDAKDVLTKVRDAYSELPTWLKVRLIEDNRLSMKFSNGSQIRASSTTKKSGVGQALSLLIIDEAALIEDAEELWTSAQPALSTGGSSIILSCVTKDTFVFTDKGIKSIKDFIDNTKIGGYKIEKYGVLGYNNIRYGNLFHNNGNQETNIIKTKFSSLECTNNHKLWAYNKKYDKFDWYRSDELSVGDFIAIQYGKQIWGNNDCLSKFNPSSSNKIHSPFIPKYITPELAYFCGLYIAKGSCYKIFNKNQDFVGGSITITCGDDISSIFSKLNLIYSCTDGIHYTISNKNLIELMEYLGFNLSYKACNKQIPSRLMEISPLSMKWLLRGIFDGDGCFTKKSIKLTSTSEILIDQVRIILNNFGILAGKNCESIEKLNKRKSKIRYNNSCYNLEIYGRFANLFFNKIGFNLERKQIKSKFYCEMNLNRACSHDVIPSSLSLIKKDNIYWTPIISINKSKNETYDFSLSDDENDFWAHSIIYNGVLGHNTPRGIGNFFHKIWTGSEEGVSGGIGKNGFHSISLPWNLHPERDEEWRRVEGEKQGSEKKASQEYDCNFLASGNTVIDLIITDYYRKNKVKDPVEIVGIDKGLWIWKYPNYEHNYIVSGDPARGDGEDFSAAHVIDVSETVPIQVAEYKGSINTKDFGNFLVELATRYNDALLVVERENMGWASIQAILDREYKNMFYSSSDLKYVEVQRQLTNKWNTEQKKLVPGFSTNIKTRPLIINNLERYFHEMAIEIYSKRTISELETFIWKNGKAVAMEGYNDDLCVLEDTWIKTKDGYKMISDIEIGEYVLTHKNRYRKVTSKFISEKSEYNILESVGKMNLGITSNHPIYIFDKIKEGESYYKLNQTWNRISNASFKSINEIQNIKNKYLVSAISTDIVDVSVIDLWDYASDNYCLCGDDEITSMIINKNKAKINPKSNNISRYISLDNEFCFLMGYFLAEGSKSKNGISFASHKKEYKIRNYISNILSKYGFNPFVYYSKNNLGCILMVQSLILKNFFADFGKSYDKKLPLRFSNLPREKLIYILSGYLAGDGHFKDTSIRSATISPHIAFQMYEIASKCGIISTIKGLTNPKAITKICHFRKSQNVSVIQPLIRMGFNFIDHPAINLLYTLRDLNIPKFSKKYTRIKIKNNFVLGEIISIKPIKLNNNIKLYNLEVEEDNSYMANGIVVHNCMSLAIGLWIRDTALRLRLEGMDLMRKSLDNIKMKKKDQTPFYKTKQSQIGSEAWQMKTGSPRFGNPNTEKLDWLL